MSAGTAHASKTIARLAAQVSGTTLEDDLLGAIDPCLLSRRVGVEPDAWQAKALRSRGDRLILNTSRQSGKSTTAGIKALHTAIYEPNSLILLVSPSQRQSLELFRKVIEPYRALGRPVPAESENRLSLELENGSRIVLLPGNEGTVRGFSGVRLLIIDEAARVEDALYGAVRPMLAVAGGTLWAMSTPFGAKGWFYDAWRSVEKWERFEIPASACPRISADFLAEEKRTMGEWWYRQEYECTFMAAATSLFSAEEIEAMFSKELRPWPL